MVVYLEKWPSLCGLSTRPIFLNEIVKWLSGRLRDTLSG